MEIRKLTTCTREEAEREIGFQEWLAWRRFCAMEDIESAFRLPWEALPDLRIAAVETVDPGMPRPVDLALVAEPSPVRVAADLAEEHP